MLVLSRKEGERIFIGPEIVLTVVKVRSNGTVRIGINAPEWLRIVRHELGNDAVGEIDLGGEGD